MQRLNRMLQLARQYRAIKPSRQGGSRMRLTRNLSSKDTKMDYGDEPQETIVQMPMTPMSIPQCRQPCFTNPTGCPFGCGQMQPPNFPPPTFMQPAMQMRVPPLPASYGLPPEGNPAWFQQPQPCPTCGRFHSSAQGRSQTSIPPGNCCSNFYEKRKFGHQLSSNRQDDASAPPFEPLPEFPVGIFRDTTGEQLGPCAGKDAVYMSPEYYAYHHMSYYDLHLNLRRYRIPSPDSHRKP